MLLNLRAGAADAMARVGEFHQAHQASKIDGNAANQHPGVADFTVSVKRLLTTAISDKTMPCSPTQPSDCLHAR
jgi:hypothetical protein